MSYDDRPWLKWYDDGVKPEVRVPDETALDRLLRVRDKYSGRPALYFLGRTITYARLFEHSARFAQALSKAGCRPGDVVAINLPNIPQYLVAQIGAIMAGCAASGLSPLLTAPEMVHQLKDSRAAALVTLDAVFEKRFLEIEKQLPDLKFVAAAGLLDYASPVKRLLGNWLKKVPTGKVTPLPGRTVARFKEMLKENEPNPPEVKITPDHTMLVQYTGGTTGLPKGAMLTHRNFISNLAQFDHWMGLEPGREVFLSGFPFFHLAGLGVGMLGLSLGAAQILIPNPRDTKFIVKEMSSRPPTFMTNVPSLYMMLTEDEGFRKLDFSVLSCCISGAAPYPAESILELEKIIGPGKVVEVYGMTETSPLITMNPRRGRKKIGSVGLPLPSTRIRLVDLENGVDQVPVGEEGELICQGPQVMKGYHGKPAETAAVLRQAEDQIWIHTGDIARMDEDGFFYIVDRAKDMLNVGGYKVFSRELEDKFYSHPAIELCAVVGLPNRKRPGSEIVKLVVQKSAAWQDRTDEETRAAIDEYARANLSAYKVPKVIEFVSSMPLTNVGKVDKKALR